MAIALGACSGDKFEDQPADLSGEYVGPLTNGESSCPIAGWEVGETSGGIPLTVTQSGSSVSANVGGIAGEILNYLFGNEDPFVGTASGPAMTLTRHGSASLTWETCALTLRGTIEATVAKETMTATITYVPDTNEGPDCAQFEDCEGVQSFAGTLRVPDAGD